MKRSKFSLSHYRLFTCDMGELIPCGLFEVLPGDTVQQSTSMLVRCSPLLAPVMHPVQVRIHHWFVPFRLLWDDFEDFITGGPDGMNASVFPTRSYNGSSAVGSLADYLGLPPTAAAMPVSALPYRAYNMIWNEWYRDQDLQTEQVISTASGNDNTTNVSLLNVNWEKDYFTSARPWEQKGPAITIPLSSSPAPITGLGIAGDASANIFPGKAVRETKTGSNPTYANSLEVGTGGSSGLLALTDSDNATSRPQIFADLSNISAVTVNVLREALVLQRYEEARARYGSRYVEYLRYLGVRSSDARLQRPEYLGGGKQVIQFSEVLQTAEGTDPVGDLKGHGIAALRSNRYRRFFEEHGFVMSLLSVKPRTMYMQSMSKLWNRRTKEDFWQKELQHIGQQEVLNKEVYAAHGTPDGVFGFQDRYDEYRRIESLVSGEFRTTLNHWHLAREFASAPALNDAFVKSVPTERVFAVPSTDVLWIMANHSIQARRMVAKVGSSHIF